MLYDNRSQLVDIPGEATIDYVIMEEDSGDRDRMSILTLFDSQPSDAGRYACVAINNVTSTQESALLIVQGKCLLHIIV